MHHICRNLQTYILEDLVYVELFSNVSSFDLLYEDLIYLELKSPVDLKSPALIPVNKLYSQE
jgi:hypothetical protein